MLGDKSSIIGKMFLNPLVWVGLLLTVLTLNYEKNVYEVFFLPKTYGLLAIGAAVYVGLFAVHYTENRAQVDWAETLMEVLLTMGMILASWVISLSLVTGYRLNGENMRDRVAQQMAERAAAREEEAREEENGYIPNDSIETNALSDVEMLNEIIRNQGGDGNKSYIITPDGNGGYSIEVIGE